MSLSADLLKRDYGSARSDIDAAFVDRAVRMLTPGGTVGGIYNRTQFFKGTLEDWRDRNLIRDRTISACIDLGYGVLDGAVVEAAAYVVSRPVNGMASAFISALADATKERAVVGAIGALRHGTASQTVHVLNPRTFMRLPGHRISYWVAPRLLSAFVKHAPLEGTLGYARQGLITADNDRFIRLAWEVEPSAIARTLAETSTAPSGRQSRPWVFYAKGGDYAPFYGDVHLVVQWSHDGREIRSFFRDGELASRPQNTQYYFQRALTYTERTASDISPRVMPEGCIFDCKGPIIARANENIDLMALLALVNSKVFKYFVELSLAAGDSSVSGSAARQYTQSIVGSVPVPSTFLSIQHELAENARDVWAVLARADAALEESRLFVAPYGDSGPLKVAGLRELADEYEFKRLSRFTRLLDITSHIDAKVIDLYQLDSEAVEDVERSVGKHPNKHTSDAFRRASPSEQVRYLTGSLEELIAEFVIDGRGSRAVTKMSYYADRRIEVLASAFDTRPSDIIESKQRLQATEEVQYRSCAESVLSYTVGVAMSRWDIRCATGERPMPEAPGPFAPLPVCPPGALTGADGLPLSPETGRQLRIEGRYPLDVAWDGVLVDDAEHPLDVERLAHAVLTIIWREREEAIEQEACTLLRVPTLREWFRRPAYFFADHLKRYSKSRRQAPIYWPLSTPSGSYTLWLYYHRLTDQTLFKAANDFVDPKRQQIASQAAALRGRTSRSSADNAELERLSDLQIELTEFRDELLRLAKVWKPNLNDGVVITAAPLWKLFQFKPWQKKLKETWEALEAGEYDWAHLAYSLWPDRVREKCRHDKSLAIAHGLEELYQEPPAAAGKKRGRKAKVVDPALMEDAE